MNTYSPTYSDDDDEMGDIVEAYAEQEASDRPTVTDNARAETVGNDGLTDAEREEYARRYRTGPAFQSVRTPLDAGRAETTTEDYPDAEGLAALRENAETTTATTEDVARLLQRYAARESVVIFGGAAQEIAQALADAGLPATARTRPRPTHAQVMEAVAAHLGWQPGLIEAADEVLALFNEKGD